MRISITSPEDGSTVGRRVTVTGRATPGTTVLVANQDIARADSDGRWEAEVELQPPRATIEAGTASADVTDSVRVEVRAPKRAPAPRPEAEPTLTPVPPRPERVVVVGDSLAEGIEPLLPALLPDEDVSIDALTGRPLAAGMRIIGGMDLGSEPTVLAVSLFTNDDPGAVDTLESAVRASVDAVAPEGCAVWATIVRPPLNGVSYDAANARLLALDAELEALLVVPWAEQVAESPELLADDGVHGTPEGYQARAALYAEAIRSCGA